MRKYIYYTLILILILGCSENFSNDNFLKNKPRTYEWLMENAWSAFSNSEFDLAINYFRTAADRDATKSEPYLGLGWSYARSTSMNLVAAESNFNTAIIFSEFDPSGAIFEKEARAGLAVIFWASGNSSLYENAISQINLVLSADPGFEFRYDPNISSTAIEAIKYQLQYNLGDITSLYNELTENGMSLTSVSSASGWAYVSHTESTGQDGIHTGTLQEIYEDTNNNCQYDAGENFIDENGNDQWDSDNTSFKLISISSLESCDLGLEYEVLDVDEGLNTFTFQGNPVLDDGEAILLTYNYTTDYGSFINELLGLLANQ